MSMGPHCAPGHYHVSEFSGYLVLLESDFTGLSGFTGLPGNLPVTRQPQSFGSRCHFDFSVLMPFRL